MASKRARRISRLCGVLFAVAFGASNARAEGPTPSPSQPAPESPSKKAKKVKQRSDKGELEVEGRVVARAEFAQREATVVAANGALEERRIDSLDLRVEQARFGVHYQSPLPWLSAKLSIDAADKVRPRDVYVQAEDQGLLARAGQFKMPVGAWESTSSWQLPTADRGFVHDLLVDRLQVGGRRPGFLAAVEMPAGLRPRLVLGAFQGSELVDESSFDTDLMSEHSLGAQSLLARVEGEASVVRFGAFYEWRVGVPAALVVGEEPSHYSTVGADVVVDWEFGSGGLRLWADGFSGASWFEHSGKMPDDTDVTFLAGRLGLAPRWGGTKKWQFYVEPFVLVGVLDPDLTVVRDDAYELACGVNAGFWRRARLTLQAEVNRTESNFPESLRLTSGSERRALIAQAGVAF